MKHQLTLINIVIASVLKPINDTRMFEKLGMSLSSLQHYNIHIIGQNINEKKIYPNIHFYPIFNFRRLDISRIFAPFKYIKLLLKLKPKVVIVCTHELLIVTFIYKILFGTKIIYDIQENYFANILYTNTFSPIIRHAVAFYVRMKEIIFAPAISHFILAEKCYKNELPFIKKNYTVVENKVKFNKLIKELPQKHNISPTKELKLLYTGTIHESYGILEAIQFTKKLQQIHTNVSLIIIGYCASNQLLINIKKEVDLSSCITLIGGDTLVPHEEILLKIHQADVVLAPYQHNLSTLNRIPTKFYECIALKTIILTSINDNWSQLMEEYNAGICIDFDKINCNELYHNLIETKFYKKTFSNNSIYFDSELVQNIVSNILK